MAYSPIIYNRNDYIRCNEYMECKSCNFYISGNEQCGCLSKCANISCDRKKYKTYTSCKDHLATNIWRTRKWSLDWFIIRCEILKRQLCTCSCLRQPNIT